VGPAAAEVVVCDAEQHGVNPAIAHLRFLHRHPNNPTRGADRAGAGNRCPAAPNGYTLEVEELHDDAAQARLSSTIEHEHIDRQGDILESTMHQVCESVMPPYE
jgi:hypothetical protein